MCFADEQSRGRGVLGPIRVVDGCASASIFQDYGAIGCAVCDVLHGILCVFLLCTDISESGIPSQP